MTGCRAVAAVIHKPPSDWKRPPGRPNHPWLRAIESDRETTEHSGDAESARHELAGHENARHENARNAIVWNTKCCICLSIAEQECMSRQERAPDFADRPVFSCLAFSVAPFHYGQAVMKRLKKIGLTQAYQNEETTQAVFRCLLALPLLPVTDIDPAFQDVKVLVHDDTPSKHCCCNCVERQWLNKSSIGAAGMSVRGNPARTNS